jgi:hypothetical protein
MWIRWIRIRIRIRIRNTALHHLELFRTLSRSPSLPGPLQIMFSHLFSIEDNLTTARIPMTLENAFKNRIR